MKRKMPKAVEAWGVVTSGQLMLFWGRDGVLFETRQRGIDMGFSGLIRVLVCPIRPTVKKGKRKP